MIARYDRARTRAHWMTSWRLRRIERHHRRRSDHLGAEELVMWACTRDELRDRGADLPDADERPRWWQR